MALAGETEALMSFWRLGLLALVLAGCKFRGEVVLDSGIPTSDDTAAVDDTGTTTDDSSSATDDSATADDSGSSSDDSGESADDTATTGDDSGGSGDTGSSGDDSGSTDDTATADTGSADTGEDPFSGWSAECLASPQPCCVVCTPAGEALDATTNVDLECGVPHNPTHWIYMNYSDDGTNTGSDDRLLITDAVAAGDVAPSCPTLTTTYSFSLVQDDASGWGNGHLVYELVP